MRQKDEREKDMTVELGALPRGPALANGEPAPEIGKEIAKQLRALYARHVSEPLPDKIVNLLSQLAKPEQKDER